jgi:hypothetical protein
MFRVPLAIWFVLFFSSWLGAQETPSKALNCTIPNSYTLTVTLRPQETEMWCWAASGEMIMKTLRPRTKVTQCGEANREFGRTDCCKKPTPEGCIDGGWPEFSKYKFDSKPKDGPLDFADAQRELFCKQRPFAFSWHWNGGGGHMMVAIGYRIVNGTQYIIKDDPLPPNQGQDSVAITYQYFVKGSDHTHWRDYFDVVPQ